jgi:transposase
LSVAVKCPHRWQMMQVPTAWRRRNDIWVFFEHHPSNAPTQAINGRLEALRCNGLDSEPSPQYRWRSLLHSGALDTLGNAL